MAPDKIALLARVGFDASELIAFAQDYRRTS